MAGRMSFSSRERELRSRLHSLLNQAEDFLHGSPVEMARRCGNPKCKCAAADEHKHRCLCLGQTRKGKTTTVYVPKHLEAKVRSGIKNFSTASDLLEELNLEARKRLEKAKAAKPGEKSSPRKPGVKKKNRRETS